MHLCVCVCVCVCVCENQTALRVYNSRARDCARVFVCVCAFLPKAVK
jgi:hypothetical protein